MEIPLPLEKLALDLVYMPQSSVRYFICCVNLSISFSIEVSLSNIELISVILDMLCWYYQEASIRQHTCIYECSASLLILIFILNLFCILFPVNFIFFSSGLVFAGMSTKSFSTSHTLAKYCDGCTVPCYIIQRKFE